ncbi:MAG: DASS family sodium-coupled anion symporter [Bdellovibrionota bacterium]|nr:MAG: DASS family sodium-coupled anion symporter [Bdellovibrionota bacterium]
MSDTPAIRWRLIVALLVLPPLACFGLDLSHAVVLSIFLSIIGLWLTEALPLPVTGLLVPVLSALYGVLPASEAFNSFGSDILFLFLACFLMSQAMDKYGFDKRIAYFLLGRCMPGTSFRNVNLVIGVASFALSMWISNTSATAIMAAISLGILTSLNDQVRDPMIRERMATRLLLTVAFSASIGGLATPVGSPPNLIALSLLSRQGITISFIEWMAIGLPLSLLMLGALFLIMDRCFPLRDLSFPGIQIHFLSLLRAQGPLRGGELQIAIIFASTVALWVLPSTLVSLFPDSSLLQTINARLSMSVVGLMGGIAAFCLPVTTASGLRPHLSWEETSKVEWGTLMLFGGGLTLGLLLDQGGVAHDIGQYLIQAELSNFLLFSAVVVVISILTSEFASNTAAAAILIPIILGATLGQGALAEDATLLVLAVTFAASFGFMLPVSTPPNAIVYGTGRVPAASMRRAGVYFDILGALLIVGYLALLR